MRFLAWLHHARNDKYFGFTSGLGGLLWLLCSQSKPPKPPICLIACHSERSEDSHDLYGNNYIFIKKLPHRGVCLSIPYFEIPSP